MDQFLSLIRGLSLKQRISIVIAALAVIGGMVAFVHWKHEGDFRPLYTGMAPEDAAGVVQKLRESGVEYRLSDNGGSVLVPSAKLAESRLALAAAGLPKTGRIGFELFDKNNFGATEFVEHVNYKRALEGELERSVMSLAEVEDARVHLSLPEESVFLDQQKPAKASVVVKLRPGAQVSPQNVAAITNLVASAVEGLSPDAVSVVDMDGELLSRPRKPAAAGNEAEASGEVLEARQQIERSLVTKINETLQPLLGAEGFRAGASVDVDLTSGDQQEETLDPNHSVMVSSQKTEETSERGGESGVPGTASNLPQQASAPKSGSGTSRRTENVTYETSRVVRHTTIPQGVVKRMSLAVLVDQGVHWEGSGANRRRVLDPPPPEKLQTIKSLVAAVTGYNEQRGDQLTVETLPFEATLNLAPPSAPKPLPAPVKTPAWLDFLGKYRDVWAPAALGLGVLMVVLRTLFGGSRKRSGEEVRMAGELPAAAGGTEFSPQAAGPGGAESLPLGGRGIHGELGPAGQDDAAELAERVRQVAKREPALAVNVLRMWLQENSKTS